jgi:predicted transcriptional regulator
MTKDDWDVLDSILADNDEGDVEEISRDVGVQTEPECQRCFRC